jgi:hypothetical protein
MSSAVSSSSTVKPVRHCSYCRETTHACNRCPALQAVNAARAAAEEAEAARRAEEKRLARERERVEFAAQPLQDQILTLRDMLLSLQKSVDRLADAHEDLRVDFERHKENHVDPKPLEYW